MKEENKTKSPLDAFADVNAEFKTRLARASAEGANGISIRPSDDRVIVRFYRNDEDHCMSRESFEWLITAGARLLGWTVQK